MEPINLQDLKIQFKEKFDLFICSSSFEERCFQLPREVTHLNPIRSLIFYNSNEYPSVKINAIELKKILKSEYDPIELDTSDPTQNAAVISRNVQDILSSESVKSILVDISTFTRESLLVLYKILHLFKDSFSELHLGYVGGKDYSTDVSDPKQKWLSSGITGIRSVVGYPGSISPARKNHLILLLGFEIDRAEKLIKHLAFHSVSVGIGKDENEPAALQNINAEKLESLQANIPGLETFEFSLSDPFSVDSAIRSVLKTDYNSFVAPMNNKISTIGAAMTAMGNTRVQLIYAKPYQYNEKAYSEPRQDVFIIKII